MAPAAGLCARLPGGFCLSSKEASPDPCAAPRDGQEEMGLDGPLPCSALPCQPHDGTTTVGGCQAPGSGGPWGAGEPCLPSVGICAHCSPRAPRTADVLQLPSPGQAEPSLLCLGPFPQHVRGDQGLAAPRPPAAPPCSPARGRGGAGWRRRRQGRGLFTLCLFPGARLLFFTDLFFLHRSSSSE